MFGFAEPPQQCGVNFPLCSLISLSFYRLREIRSRTVELCVITGAVFCVLSCWQLGKVVNDLSIKKSGYPSKSTVELIFLFDWVKPNPIKRKNPFGHLCPYSLPGRGQGEGDTPACRQRVGMVPEKIKTKNDTAPT